MYNIQEGEVSLFKKSKSMKKGDRFIFYGEKIVIKGEVESTFEKKSYDLKNGVKVVTPYIRSVTGETFNEKQCLKIDSEIRPSFLKRVLQHLI